MIQPEDIRRKAERLYGELLQSWVCGSAVNFPRVITGRKQPDPNLATAMQQIQHLRDSSKEVLGYGYSIQWREVNSRKYGRNPFPAEIFFETIDDFLRCIHKTGEFGALTGAVKRIRSTLPELELWIRGNVRSLIQLATEVDGLIDAATFLKEHPRPGCFVRELPLSVDTKFIERHKNELRQWLDILLPAHAIRADEEHFERRFGLRYAEPHLLIRFLDPAIQAELGFPCDVLSLPLQTISDLPVKEARVIIVENKINLLTLPRLYRTIGLGSLGHGVALLRYADFITREPVLYWGDLDVEGFEILSALRRFCPHAKSLWMDQAAVERWEKLKVAGTGRQPMTPAHLTEEERAAFDICCRENIRIEQERLPQDAVATAIKQLDI
jgi:hypothetical protein